MDCTRRQFLDYMKVPVGAAAALALLQRDAHGTTGVETAERLHDLAGDPRSPDAIARDEAFWFPVQQAFTVDRSMINLNNGGVSPSPRIVQDAMRRHQEFSNSTATSRALWTILEPRRETVRAGLAELFGCDAEEIALTRNASESLQICQNGFDFEPGDEVLTTDQDYPRMLNTFVQLGERSGVVLRKIAVPVPATDPDELVARFEEAITPRTRLMLMCHVINLTGQILPVRAVAALARRKGVPLVVDGAHSFAHFVFDRDGLDCDYYATSLHKWLFAPHGTGMLFVRKDRIADLWPLTAGSPEQRGDIRKFEEIGTHPAAPYLAIAEALAFHHGIGPARKEARMRYLRDVWATRLLEHDRVRLHTSLDPRYSCGLANVAIDGVEPGKLASWLWDEHRIVTTAIAHPDCTGVRVTPSVYTTMDELDRFCTAMEEVIRTW